MLELVLSEASWRPRADSAFHFASLSLALISAVMFRLGVFALFGSCRGLVVSKPAGIADLQDIAQLAVNLADGYAAEANAQQSPESVLKDMNAADAQMFAELSAGEGGPCADSVASSASFLSAGPEATIHLAEPDDALAQEVAKTAEALSSAIAALEQRQDATEAMMSSIAVPGSS